MGEAKRTLGVDLGRRRVGLALSDPLGITAQPLGVLERGRGLSLEEEVARRAIDNGVERIVVGYPLLLSGEVGRSALEAERFALRLRQRLPDLDVVLWDERWTTAEVERAMLGAGLGRGRRKRLSDLLAAVVILQSFLDRSRQRRRSDP